MRYVFLILLAAFLASPSSAQMPDKYKEPEKYRKWREDQLIDQWIADGVEPPLKTVPADGMRKITVDGIARHYLFNPAQDPVSHDDEGARQAPAKKRPPLLVVIPDAKGLADSVKLGPIPDKAREAGRAVVFLETAREAQGMWNDGRAGTAFRDKSGKVIDDVAYFRAVVADVTARGEADPAKVFVAGAGSGSILAQRIVCRGETALAGAMFFLATTPEPFTESCAHKNPMSFLVVHATQDALFPFDGTRPRDLPRAASATPMLSGEDSAAFWRKVAKCGAKATDISPSDVNPDDDMSVAHIRHDCAGRKTVDWIRLEGAGHNLPLGANAAKADKGSTEMFGPRNYDFDVSVAAEDFMQRAGGK